MDRAIVPNESCVKLMRNRSLAGFLLETDVDSLRRKQYEAYKEYVLSVLNLFVERISKDGNLAALVEDFTELSPAGDGQGEDNRYIDFGLSPSCAEEDESLVHMDIADACALLMRLRTGEGWYTTRNKTLTKE